MSHETAHTRFRYPFYSVLKYNCQEYSSYLYEAITDAFSFRNKQEAAMWAGRVLGLDLHPHCPELGKK